MFYSFELDIVWGCLSSPCSETSTSGASYCQVTLLLHSYLGQVQTPDTENTNQSLFLWNLEFESGKTLGQLAHLTCPLHCGYVYVMCD